jgi:hypothetical protein
MKLPRIFSVRWRTQWHSDKAIHSWRRQAGLAQNIWQIMQNLLILSGWNWHIADLHSLKTNFVSVSIPALREGQLLGR